MMWNDKVEATPKVQPSWLVPVLFVGFAIFGLVIGVIYGQFF